MFLPPLTGLTIRGRKERRNRGKEEGRGEGAVGRR